MEITKEQRRQKYLEEHPKYKEYVDALFKRLEKDIIKKVEKLKLKK